MPGSVLNVLNVLTNVESRNLEVGTLLMPVFYGGNQGREMFKALGKVPTAGSWWGQDSNPDPLAPKPAVPATTCHCEYQARKFGYFLFVIGSDGCFHQRAGE